MPDQWSSIWSVVCRRREQDKSGLFFKSRMASYHLGVESMPFLQRWQSIFWKWGFSVNEEDDFFPLYFSFYMKRSIWHLAIVSLLFGSSSHYHYHYYWGSGRHKAKEAYNISLLIHAHHRREKIWVQGLHNSNWTPRSIGYSISCCHSNSTNKDRAPPFIYTCLLFHSFCCRS